MMHGLVLSMVLWVSQQTGLPMPQHLPNVHILNDTTFCNIYGKHCHAKTVHPVAFYDHGEIFLKEPFDPDSLPSLSILVHEIVHHLQTSAGWQYPCIPAGEPLAYNTQAKWLKSLGVQDPWSVMGIDRFTVIVVSLCSEQ